MITPKMDPLRLIFLPFSFPPFNKTIDRIARDIPKTDIALNFSDQKKCPIIHGNIIPEE